MRNPLGSSGLMKRRLTRRNSLVRLGIDTGGTFTDFVAALGSRSIHFKVRSTPQNPAEAILTGIRRLIDEFRLTPSDIVHGTTVATNALLERKGARTALITTSGFEDVIEIGRQARPEIYDLMVRRPPPLVERDLRIGVHERVGPDGSAIEPLDRASLDEAISKLRTAGANKTSPSVAPATSPAARQASGRNAGRPVESIAVCLLFSFANPDNERAIAAALRPLGIPVSLSHEILPEYREYERTSTVAINAYLVPLMSRYLEALSEGLNDPAIAGRSGETRSSNRLRVMQSNGGSVSAATAAREPVRAILSGPAGGVVGALRIAEAAALRDILTFDMGGTSTDVALCRGAASTTNEATVSGLPVAVPVIDIHTVGAGGGSIARVDAAGALRVGPESAGAVPGPACYGQGSEPTVTDANLVLGRFGGASLLGGEMPIDENRARAALSRLAQEMSRFGDRRFTPEQAALGVIRVANTNMEAALRVVSVERGQDPRLFTLVCFGGAGGLHACDLAVGLRIPRVLVPFSPGTLSALGVLMGDVVKDYSRTVMVKQSSKDPRAIEAVFSELEGRAALELRHEGFQARSMKFLRSAALRYAGQSFEIDVPWSAGVERAFHHAHRERYGYGDSSRPTEIVSLRLRASGITLKPTLSRRRKTSRSKPRPDRIERVFLAERPTQLPVYSRDSLESGARIAGPAVITEYGSTTLLPPNWRVRVDAALNLIIEKF
jgi:N-methylhydantoinase A